MLIPFARTPNDQTRLEWKSCNALTSRRVMNMHACTTVRVPGIKAKCLDPTGAGDAFTAALIYGLAHELSLEATGQLANWFAAQVITRIGSRSFPAKSRINRFLEKLSVKTTPV